MDAREVLEDVKKAFAKKVSVDKSINKFLSLLDSGKNKASFTGAYEYSKRLGEILGDVIASKSLEMSIDEFKEIASEVITPILKQNHALVVAAGGDAQKLIDKADNISLGIVKPDPDKGHIEQIVNDVKKAESSAELANNLKKSTGTFTESAFDRFIKDNANFRFDIGMRPQVIRIYEGPHKEHTNHKNGGTYVDCEYCKKWAGTYDYGDIPPEVWGRHDGCHCTIIYKNHSKKSLEVVKK